MSIRRHLPLWLRRVFARLGIIQWKPDCLRGVIVYIEAGSEPLVGHAEKAGKP